MGTNMDKLAVPARAPAHIAYEVAVIVG